jgi:hypothetical protein
MDWTKTIWKFASTFIIAIGVFLLTALVNGLGLLKPDNPLLAQVWAMPGVQAAVMGALAATINWLKHKDDEVAKKNSPK